MYRRVMSMLVEPCPCNIRVNRLMKLIHKKKTSMLHQVSSSYKYEF